MVMYIQFWFKWVLNNTENSLGYTTIWLCYIADGDIYFSCGSSGYIGTPLVYHIVVLPPFHCFNQVILQRLPWPYSMIYIKNENSFG
jgi:hypothetical protein